MYAEENAFFSLVLCQHEYPISIDIHRIQMKGVLEVLNKFWNASLTHYYNQSL